RRRRRLPRARRNESLQHYLTAARLHALPGRRRGICASPFPRRHRLRIRPKPDAGRARSALGRKEAAGGLIEPRDPRKAAPDLLGIDVHAAAINRTELAAVLILLRPIDARLFVLAHLDERFARFDAEG